MMTREEAIEELERLLSHWDDLENGKRSFRWYSKDAVEVAISALRPVSREQVEKGWRSEWEVDEFGHKCSKCGEYLPSGDDDIFPQFCPNCGDAKTDEAVDMMMERIEALYDNRT